MRRDTPCHRPPQRRLPAAVAVAATAPAAVDVDVAANIWRRAGVVIVAF